MRLSLRFGLPLVAALVLLAVICVALSDRLIYAWMTRDLDMRSRFAEAAVRPSLDAALAAADLAGAAARLEDMAKDERVLALGFCDSSGKLLVRTAQFPPGLRCLSTQSPKIQRRVLELRRGLVHVAHVPFKDDAAAGRVVVVHDMSYAVRRSEFVRSWIFVFFLLLGLVVSAVTLVIAKLTISRWVAGVTKIIQDKGEVDTVEPAVTSELLPIIRELRSMLSEVESSPHGTGGAKTLWSPKALKQVLVDRFADAQVIIVSNREPYIHQRKNGGIDVQVPPSGLVTALEPVVKCCSGTWVAYGSGEADRDVVDEHDRVLVPPGENSYRLRRVWMTEDEENGFYYGFSNEGIWPLCHIAHMRPVFRKEDWEQYQHMNQRFTNAVIEEAVSEDPVVLVQDYHFALLPAMLRYRMPKATIITFWHIPWPNPEAFGICPWRNELLAGLLGSTILGFHTRFHCNNFLESVDRYLECRIDREHSAVSHLGRLTVVRNYPISIEWRDEPVRPAHEARAEVFRRHSLPPDAWLALGVDRLDYTKGIVERIRAVQRLLQRRPDWIGKFVLIQIAAPTRTKIDPYRRFEREVRDLVEEVNSGFTNGGCPPVLLLDRYHGQQAIQQYFRAADVCLVTSLHDGMNLVAKEFVAARHDESGVLILSMFTGASRELPEALIVNPYNTEQCARALEVALTMPEDEKRSRMMSMRAQVREFNVFRWAGRMLIDAAQIRERMRLVDQLSEWRPSEDLALR